MNINWGMLEKRHQEILDVLMGEVSSNQRGALQKELSHLEGLLGKKNEINSLQTTLERTNQELENEQDPDLRALLEAELIDLRLLIQQKNNELEDLMVPADPHDSYSVFLEIRAGTGGQEASLFAADLARMYSNYALKQGWRVAVVDQSYTSVGGIRDITLHVQGDGVYGSFKREAGVHRVQRVPKTENSGRIHTSTATVAVLPEAKEVDVTINPADLRIDTYRASGAGGQHVNTTDSAIRITHVPTGVVVTCQDERSQHKNKAKALKMLQSRLLASEIERHEAEIGQKRKEMVGRGMRSEKVRTYNFPQNRVTDHQVNLTLSKLDMVIEGDLDEIIDALKAQEREERRMIALGT